MSMKPDILGAALATAVQGVDPADFNAHLAGSTPEAIGNYRDKIYKEMALAIIEHIRENADIFIREREITVTGGATPPYTNTFTPVVSLAPNRIL